MTTSFGSVANMPQGDSAKKYARKPFCNSLISLKQRKVPLFSYLKEGFSISFCAKAASLCVVGLLLAMA